MTNQPANGSVKYMYLLLYSASISTRKAQNRLHSNNRTKQKQMFHVHHVKHVFFFLLLKRDPFTERIMDTDTQTLSVSMSTQ